MSEPVLSVQNVHKQFGVKHVLGGVSLEVQKGEIVSLLGMSGCGKTTLFNVISGLLPPESGRVFCNGTDCTGKTGSISYMMQKDLLLPWFTILDNTALPLRIQGFSRKEARTKAAEHFAAFGLQNTEKLYPRELSGGMKQRAALLRTYLFSSQVALLDEPFCALDAITKQQMHVWFANIMQQLSLSALFITHDIDEALLLSDRVLIMGGEPAHICAEFAVPETRTNRQDFLLSSHFLECKKKLLAEMRRTEANTE